MSKYNILQKLRNHLEVVEKFIPEFFAQSRLREANEIKFSFVFSLRIVSKV